MNDEKVVEKLKKILKHLNKRNTKKELSDITVIYTIQTETPEGNLFMTCRKSTSFGAMGNYTEIEILQVELNGEEIPIDETTEDLLYEILDKVEGGD